MINRKEFVARWSRALEARSACVFVGAGLSRAAGYPDWRTLLRDIAKDIGLDISNEHDLAGVAQYSVNRSAGNRNKLKAAIISHFPPKAKAPEPFRVLARLPLRHVWTTNYDNLVETAWDAERKLVDVKSRNGDLGHEMPWAQTILYKMHGTVSHPGEVVIAKDDYELYRRARPGFLQLLAGHLVGMEMLFLGFSFTDPNLAHLFASIRETFRGDGPRHYAIVRKPQRGTGIGAAKRLKSDQIRHTLWMEDLQRYGIECIEIDDYDEINDILKDVELQIVRSSVLVSGSFPESSAASLASKRPLVQEVASRVGHLIASRGKRLVSGYGVTVGSASIGGALGVVLSEASPNLERSLLLRPFPQQSPPGISKATFQRFYREAMVRHAGVCIFIAGCTIQGGNVQVARGVIEEYLCAKSAGRICIPIAATGFAAEDIWNMMSTDWSNSSNGIPKRLFNALRTSTTPAKILEAVSDILAHFDN
jgi:hypothetical protein